MSVEKQKIEQLEANLIEQEHRIFRVLQNLAWPESPKLRKSAVKALIFWFLGGPQFLVIGGGLVSLITIWGVFRQSTLVAEQNEILRSQTEKKTDVVLVVSKVVRSQNAVEVIATLHNVGTEPVFVSDRVGIVTLETFSLLMEDESVGDPWQVVLKPGEIHNVSYAASWKQQSESVPTPTEGNVIAPPTAIAVLDPSQETFAERAYGRGVALIFVEAITQQGEAIYGKERIYFRQSNAEHATLSSFRSEYAYKDQMPRALHLSTGKEPLLSSEDSAAWEEWMKTASDTAPS